MRRGTVCFIRDNDKILLALIEYSPDFRKWNGIGGYVEEGETLKDAIVREASEETFIQLDAKDLRKVAELNVEFQVNVFLTDKWKGEVKIKEPTIKELKWFPIDKLPLDLMWPDNKIWLPKILEGKLLQKNSGQFIEVDKFE